MRSFSCTKFSLPLIDIIFTSKIARFRSPSSTVHLPHVTRIPVRFCAIVCYLCASVERQPTPSDSTKCPVHGSTPVHSSQVPSPWKHTGAFLSSAPVTSGAGQEGGRPNPTRENWRKLIQNDGRLSNTTAHHAAGVGCTCTCTTNSLDQYLVLALLSILRLMAPARIFTSFPEVRASPVYGTVSTISCGIRSSRFTVWVRETRLTRPTLPLRWSSSSFRNAVASLSSPIWTNCIPS